MTSRLLISCLRKTSCVPCRHHVLPIQIGNRDIVGGGHQGLPNYIDSTDFPFPAIRFKENTPDVMALREKEKGDWKKLTIDEKKILYRASFCQTFAEIKAPTGEWKQNVGISMIVISLALWFYYFLKNFVYPDLPPTFERERQLAQLERIKKLNVNPIWGINRPNN